MFVLKVVLSVQGLSAMRSVLQSRFKSFQAGTAVKFSRSRYGAMYLMTCFEPIRLMNPIPFNMSGMDRCGLGVFMSHSLFLSASLFVVKLCGRSWVLSTENIRKIRFWNSIGISDRQ